MPSKAKKMIGIPRLAFHVFVWRGFKLEPGFIYGLSLENEWFVYGHERKGDNGDYLVYILNDDDVWEKRYINLCSSLWKVIQTGELNNQHYKEIQKKRNINKHIGEIEASPKYVEGSLQENCYHIVTLPKELQAICRIALKRVFWRNFVLQNGHIFGLFQGEVWFVSGLEYRQSDNAVAIYITYDESKWLKNWFAPDTQIAKVIYEAGRQRLMLGIRRVTIEPAEEKELNVRYAKQDFLTQTNTYHGVSSGGMVRPK